MVLDDISFLFDLNGGKKFTKILPIDKNKRREEAPSFNFCMDSTTENKFNFDSLEINVVVNYSSVSLLCFFLSRKSIIAGSRD